MNVSYTDNNIIFEYSANLPLDFSNEGPTLVDYRKTLTFPYKIPLIPTEENAPHPLSIRPVHNQYQFPTIPLYNKAHGSFAISFAFRSPPAVTPLEDATCYLLEVGDINVYMFLRQNLNYFRVRIDGNNAVDIRDVVFEPDTDYHIFITFTSADQRLSVYLDGVFKGSFTNSSTLTVKQSTPINIISTTRYSGSNHLPKYFYYLYIYSLAFTSTSISDVYLGFNYKNRVQELRFEDAPTTNSPKKVSNEQIVKLKSNTGEILKGKVTIEGKPFTTETYKPSIVRLIPFVGLGDKYESAFVQKDGSFTLLNKDNSIQKSLILTDMSATYKSESLDDISNLNENKDD